MRAIGEPDRRAVRIAAQRLVETGRYTLDPIGNDLDEGVAESTCSAPRASGCAPGMAAAACPTSAGQNAYGFVRSRIAWAAGAPAAVQGMTASLSNAAPVQTLFQAAGGTPVKVEVGLERAATPFGLAWASSRGLDASHPAGLSQFPDVLLTLHRQIHAARARISMRPSVIFGESGSELEFAEIR